MNTIVNSSMDIASVNVHECKKCLKLETELLNKKDFVEKEIYDKLFKSFTTLEKHCISLEVDSQLNQEIFQRNNFVSNQSALSFDQLFELNELKAQSQEKDTVIKKLKERIKSLSGKMNEDKIKKDLEEIETINIELDHRVSKLIAENEHLKQTYKQLYDSIKPSRIRSKEQCDDLINQVNLKSVEISDLNASLQEKVLVITDLKDDLRNLKGKALVDNDVTKHPRVKLSTSACGSQPPGNTKKDKNRQTPSSTQKNIVEAHPRKVESSLKNKDCVVKPKGTAYMQHSKLNVNSELKCVNKVQREKFGNQQERYLQILDTSRDLLVGNACPLTRITTATEVPTALENVTPKPVVTLVYSRKPRKSKTNVLVSKSKVLKSVSANKKEPSQSWGSIVSNVPSSSLDDCKSFKFFSAARTMLIYAKAPLLLWAEAFATACYTQNHSIIRLRHGKTPYELLHEKLPDISFFHVFGALCYMTNDSENLGLLPNPPHSTPFVPPSRSDWDLLFQPLFNELLTPPPSVDHLAPEVIAPTADVVALESAASIGSPSSTIVDQDAASPSNSQTTLETQSPIILNDVEEDYHDIEVAHIESFAPGVKIRGYKDFLAFALNEHGRHTNGCEGLRLLIGNMREEVYVSQPDVFVDPDNPNHVYKLKKALYRLKQAPRAWYDMLSSFLISQDFSKGSMDPTLFIYREGNPRGIFINQSKYALESLKKYGFDSCDPVDTPMVEKSKLDEDREGKVMWCPYQARPTDKHLHTVKRIFWYLRGTINRGLWYPKDSLIALTAFADADHAGCQDTRHSTSGRMQFLGDRLVSWSSKRQKRVAISSMKAEYIAMSKHIDIRFHFIKEHVENGVIELYFVNAEYQLADIFTKALAKERIEFLINKLGMQSFTPETLKHLADEVDK
ncbi:retrovirus-related pol polyprotein from transposon TNT 1-94 [Tanacetum coccineum]